MYKRQGIICARTALIVACYGSYASTDDGIFTDGSMFVTCALFIVALLILSLIHISKAAFCKEWVSQELTASKAE